MVTKYLVQPKKKNALTRKVVYKKGKQSFAIISTWDTCKILVNEMPKPKISNSVKTIKFKDLDFHENAYGYKDKLVLSENCKDSDIKIIRKHFKEGQLYSLEYDYDWKISKTSFALMGDYESLEVPVHYLELFSSEVELMEKRITKEEFEQYKNEGMSYEEFSDLSDDTEVSAPIFDELTTLSVDDVEVADFQKQFNVLYQKALSEHKKKHPPPNKSSKVPKKSELSYAVVGERWIKRSWHDLTIYEEFDFSKLEIQISKDYAFGTGEVFETFALSYKGKEFEFRDSFGANYEQFNLISSDGKRYEFEVLDEEYDEDDEDEDEDEE